MSHITVTQSQPIPMPREAHLLKRHGRFYLNMRVPQELLPLYGKKTIIRKSLDTSDYREAVSRVRLEAVRLDGEFTKQRRKLNGDSNSPVMREISDREAHDLVFQWFIETEKLSEEWWNNQCDTVDDVDREEMLDNLRTDEVVYSGGSRDYRGEEADADLDSFLKSNGLNIPEDSPAYKKLLPLFTKGLLENIRRTMARVKHQTIRPREPLFRDVYAHTPPPHAREIATVAKLVENFLKIQSNTNSSKTFRTYSIPCRLLKEFFGGNTPIDTIDKEGIERLFTLLGKAPSNATKRYPGLTLQEATELADKRNDPHRLSAKSLENYYINIKAIFNYAVDEGLLTKSPAKGRSLKAMFSRDTSPKRKAQFTAEELNLLFRDPIFIQRDDSKEPLLRNGDAWVTLLALFHGFRSNEAAQLYTEDVKSENGIPFIHIREQREDGSKGDKKLKTPQSNRRVPIHPEILKMGFLSFVKERQKDVANPRLFPDLPRGADGYFSSPFGKRFAGLVDRTIGKECKATFHSFRHMFRDALRNAEVSTEDAERLGGWQLMKHSAESEYGHGPNLKQLRKQIQKVKFANLDLMFLYIH